VTYFLTLDDIAELGAATLAREGQQFVIADVGLLQSALARPQVTVFGEDAYPTLHMKAAALIESLARNHALVDGNERLAWVATVLFLALNGSDLAAPSVDAGKQFVLGVAQGHLKLGDIAGTLESWIVPTSAEW
jgi:death-on-curing protein